MNIPMLPLQKYLQSRHSILVNQVISPRRWLMTCALLLEIDFSFSSKH